MFKDFFKYQSLGNDFILFDSYRENVVKYDLKSDDWKKFVIKACDRHFGIGADGVLILKKSENDMPEMLIFNNDGSQAEICLNGLRCIAIHLFIHYGFASEFKILVGDRLIQCSIFGSKKEPENLLVKTNVGCVTYLGQESIKISQGEFIGHVASIGNPHFILFQKSDLDWLKKYGIEIEQHEKFPNKTNTEFIWSNNSDSKKYNALVFERGCGITYSCSSGAAAIIGVLFKLKKIDKNSEIELSMLGGSLKSFVDDNENIILIAGANFVFRGSI